MCELLWDRRDRRVLSSRIGRAIAGLVVLLMSGCAHHYHATPAVNDLPALQLADNAISPGTALEGIVTPDLLGLSPEMREFVDRYISHGNDRQRMLTLHRSLRTPAMVDVTYDPGTTHAPCRRSPRRYRPDHGVAIPLPSSPTTVARKRRSDWIRH